MCTRVHMCPWMHGYVCVGEKQTWIVNAFHGALFNSENGSFPSPHPEGLNYLVKRWRRRTRFTFYQYTSSSTLSVCERFSALD